MIPTKDYLDAINRMQGAINQDGPDGPGSPQTFDQAVVLRSAAIGETMRLTLHCLLEIREMMVLQCLASGVIKQVSDAGLSALADTEGQSQDESENFEHGAGNYDADDPGDYDGDGNYREPGPREPEFDPSNPPAENTPAWYAWRHEMNSRGFPAVPLDMVAQGLTEADLSDPAKIKERMEKLAGTMPP